MSSHRCYFIHLSLTIYFKIFSSRVVVPMKEVDSVKKSNEIKNHFKNVLDGESYTSLELLVSSIAHDLNNLLTVISLNISYLASHETGSNQQIQNFEDANNAINVARRITGRLFSLTGYEEPKKEEINIKELLMPIASFALGGSCARYSIVLDENIKNIYADRSQLEQVFHNLILNAVEATINQGDAGLIEIEVVNRVVNKFEEKGSKELSAGEYVLFTVKDNGTGIRSDVKSEIFEPHFTTKENGNGLGLSTCFEIIKSNSGYIRVESEVKNGCTFFVYLVPYTENKTN